MKYNMYCKKCGAQINDHCKICPACGSDTKPHAEENQVETVSMTDFIKDMGELLKVQKSGEHCHKFQQ